MRLPLTKYDSIALTVIIVPLTLSLLCLLLLVRQDAYTEFVCLFFLQAHQETDRFLAASGVQFTQSNTQHHYRRAAFSSRFKSKVGHILAKAATLRINLNIDGAPITSRSHTHPSLSQTSRLLTSSLSLGVPVPHNPVYVRRVDPSALALSLSLHRHSYISILFSSRFLPS